MGLGLGSPLLVEPPCFLHDRRSLTEQDGIAVLSVVPRHEKGFCLSYPFA